MPLDHGYGVAIGTYVSFTREDPDDFGHWYHGILRIATPNGQYEAALDVDTPSGVGVSYRITTGLTITSLGEVAMLDDGFHALARDDSSGALDYLRSPALREPTILEQLRWATPVWLRNAAPAAQPWGPTPIDVVLEMARDSLPRGPFPWIARDGDHTLNKLGDLLTDATRLYIYGEPFTDGLGVHNVHYNQGDPPGPHQDDDGIWQDGAVLVQHGEHQVTAWQVKFNSQALHTDSHGLPT